MRNFSQENIKINNNSSEQAMNFNKKIEFQILLKVFLAFISIYSIVEIFHQKATIGLFPKEVVYQVLGDPLNFIPAKDFIDIATLLHIRLFILNIIFLILLSSLNKIVKYQKYVYPYLINFYLFAIFEVIFLLSLRYLSTIFVYPYLVSFVFLQLSILSLSLFLIKKL